jgi:hypothetical protein
MYCLCVNLTYKGHQKIVLFKKKTKKFVRKLFGRNRDSSNGHLELKHVPLDPDPDIQASFWNLTTVNSDKTGKKGLKIYATIEKKNYNL